MSNNKTTFLVVEDAFYKGHLEKLRMACKKRDDFIAFLEKKDGERFFVSLCCNSLEGAHTAFWIALIEFLQPKQYSSLSHAQEEILARCVVRGCLESGNTKVLHLFARNFVKGFNDRMSMRFQQVLDDWIAQKSKQPKILWTDQEIDSLSRVIADRTLRSTMQYVRFASSVVNYDVELFCKVWERSKFYDNDAFLNVLPLISTVLGVAKQGKLWDFYCWGAEQEEHQGKTNGKSHPFGHVFAKTLTTLLRKASFGIDEAIKKDMGDFLRRVDCWFLVQILSDACFNQGRGTALSEQDFLFYLFERNHQEVKTMTDYLRLRRQTNNSKILASIIQQCERHVLLGEVSFSFDKSSFSKKKIM